VFAVKTSIEARLLRIIEQSSATEKSGLGSRGRKKESNKG
jgi:hypothetical protein